MLLLGAGAWRKQRQCRVIVSHGRLRFTRLSANAVGLEMATNANDKGNSRPGEPVMSVYSVRSRASSDREETRYRIGQAGGREEQGKSGAGAVWQTLCL